jgi:hypothetical protein
MTKSKINKKCKIIRILNSGIIKASTGNHPFYVKNLKADKISLIYL